MKSNADEHLSSSLGPLPARGDSGFSLLELAIVIVVIGILVAIAVPFLSETEYASRKARAESAAANAERMVAIELTMNGTADSSAGTLGTELSRLRSSFTDGLAGATLDVQPAVVSGPFCVTAHIPGYGAATAGPGCVSTGWVKE